MTKESKPTNAADQSARFIETARKIGADEESSAADELMGRLARTPPQPMKDVPRKRGESKGKESARRMGKPDAKKPAR